MCVSCNAEAIGYGEIFPGWYLVRATKNDVENNPEFPKDWWGLVEANSPSFVFETTPEVEPISGDISSWCDKAAKFQEELLLSPETGYRLVSAAIQAGWNRKKDHNFAEWLFDRLGRMI